MNDKALAVLKDSGVFQFGTVETGEINFYPDIRKMCEAGKCDTYNKSWACPPAIGTLEECRERCLEYERLLVFSCRYELEDSFDYEGMTQAKKDFAKLTGKLGNALPAIFKNSMMLSNEGCSLCSECTYPHMPCRYPEKARGSLEGYGIFVSELAKQAGMTYNNGAATVTYFAGLLFNE